MTEIASSQPIASRTDVASFPLARYAFILGLFIAAGPIGIDLYLPAFPAIQQATGAEPGQVQLSLVSYFAALAMGQLFYGPIADLFGRRLPLAAGFLLFLVASISAALSSSITTLVGLRFIQGLGACGGMVLATSIARDLGTGEQAARLFGLMILVLGVSPILAPSLGAALLTVFHWQSMFWFMAAYAVVALMVIVFALKETLPPAARAASLRAAFTAYGRLLRDRSYVSAVLTGAAAQAGFFTYLAGSPNVLISFHGVTPTVYSLLFGLNAIALIGASQISAPLLRVMPPGRIIGFTTSAYLLLAIALLGATMLGIGGLVLTVGLLFCITGCLGMTFPITTLQAVENHPTAAGAASALMGSIQFGAGAIASVALSSFGGSNAVPLAATITCCAIIAWSIHHFGGKKTEQG